MMTQEYLKEILSYGHDTGVFVWNKSPSKKAKKGKVAGSVNHSGHIVIKTPVGRYRAHHLAWLWVYGKLPKHLDHINGNPKDNRISNLREVTIRQNNENTHNPHHNSKSQLIGAHWKARDSRWCSRIQKDGKTTHLGFFDTALEAHVAYLKAKCKVHPHFLLTDEEVKRIAEIDKNAH